MKYSISWKMVTGLHLAEISHILSLQFGKAVWRADAHLQTLWVTRTWQISTADLLHTFGAPEMSAVAWMMTITHLVEISRAEVAVNRRFQIVAISLFSVMTYS